MQRGGAGAIVSNSIACWPWPALNGPTLARVVPDPTRDAATPRGQLLQWCVGNIGMGVGVGVCMCVCLCVGGSHVHLKECVCVSVCMCIYVLNLALLEKAQPS